MRKVYLVIAAISVLLAIGYGLMSTTAQITTGEHAATLAACFLLFAIALGVWAPPE